MKIYKNLNADLSVQKCGTTWTGILRGSEQDINIAFNGLYNHKATEGELEFLNQEMTVAKFWTSRDRMEKFFVNSFYFRKSDEQLKETKGKEWGYLPELKVFVNQSMNELEATHEIFTAYRRTFYVPHYDLGKISAENPDEDMKDAILNHAFTDRTNTQQAEMILGNITNNA